MPEAEKKEWGNVTPTKEPPEGFWKLTLHWSSGTGGVFSNYRWNFRKWEPRTLSSEIPHAGWSIGCKPTPKSKLRLEKIVLSKS